MTLRIPNTSTLISTTKPPTQKSSSSSTAETLPRIVMGELTTTTAAVGLPLPGQQYRPSSVH